MGANYSCCDYRKGEITNDNPNPNAWRVSDESLRLRPALKRQPTDSTMVSECGSPGLHMLSFDSIRNIRSSDSFFGSERHLTCPTSEFDEISIINPSDQEIPTISKKDQQVLTENQQIPACDLQIFLDIIQTTKINDLFPEMFESFQDG
jgi:hypothetical protein